MRDKQRLVPPPRPEHIGLAYERWAPHGTDDKKSDRVNTWLERLETVSVSPEYRRFYERWRRSFGSDAVFATIRSSVETANELIGNAAQAARQAAEAGVPALTTRVKGASDKSDA